jgi:plasmid stabilization system protein ParE
LAEAELQHAFDWYEAQRASLGVQFVTELDRVFERIRRSPESAAPWSSDRPYRKQLLRRFPYVVVFEVDATGLLVLAVAHTRRRPGFWLGR